jgi:threonine dehydrogenase-like Zn-dependent dehydrogenase
MGAGPADPVARALAPAPYPRRAFTIDQPVAAGLLYITALGLYEARLNGHRIGDASLAPGWTDYTQRIPYQAYDVTSLLASGENVLGAGHATRLGRPSGGREALAVPVAVPRHRTGRQAVADRPRVRRRRRGGRQRGHHHQARPAQYLRVPLADGTLVATPDIPAGDLIPGLLAACDVLGTGWFGAVAAEAGPGKTVAVVGDGAVGLLAVLASRQLGAERIIAMSRHEPRQKLATAYGATDIVAERGDAGVARIKELIGGLGAHSVIEAVGTQESMMQAIRSTRPGGHVGYVGVAHGVELPGEELFFSHVHLHGGPAPVRRFLPELIG